MMWGRSRRSGERTERLLHLGPVGSRQPMSRHQYLVAPRVRQSTGKQVLLCMAPSVVKIRIVIWQKDVMDMNDDADWQRWQKPTKQERQISPGAANMAGIDEEDVVRRPGPVQQIGLLNRRQLEPVRGRAHVSSGKRVNDHDLGLVAGKLHSLPRDQRTEARTDFDQVGWLTIEDHRCVDFGIGRIAEGVGNSGAS